jgi:hypothetical protein
MYGRIWSLHIKPRLGKHGVRELTPKRLTRFRTELEHAKVGNATIVKAMSIVQSILSFAVTEELVEYNPGAAVKKPRYTRAREPHIFMPTDVEAIRATLGARDRALVSVLAYSGARPEEVVCRLTWHDIGDRAIRFVDTSAARCASPLCSHRWRRTCANVFSRPDDLPVAARCSRLTTEASGTTTTGAIGAAACGRASPSVHAATASMRRPHARAAPQEALVRATCAQATSRSAWTKAYPSRRSAARLAPASG